MLSNFDLEDIAENYGFVLDSVVMKDELGAIKPKKKGNFIVNMESSTDGHGTHWTLLLIRDKKSCYIDSFGVIPPQEVISFCKKIPNSHLGYSEFQMQNIKAETCGFFCCAVLIYLHNNPSKDLYLACSNFVSQFSYDTTKNNSILKAYFRKLPQSKGFKLLDKLYSQK